MLALVWMLMQMQFLDEQNRSDTLSTHINQKYWTEILQIEQNANNATVLIPYSNKAKVISIMFVF